MSYIDSKIIKDIKGHKIKLKQKSIGPWGDKNGYECECGELLIMKNISRARDFHYNYQLK